MLNQEIIEEMMKPLVLFLLMFSLSSTQVFAIEPIRPTTRLLCEQLRYTSAQTIKLTSKGSSTEKPSAIEQQINVYCALPTAQIQPKPIDKDGIDDRLVGKIIDAVAKLFSSLAWPLAIIVIARQFQKELAALLARIKRGKFGSAELEFADYVNEVEKVSDIPRTPEGERISASTLAYVSKNPREAILTAWLEVEAALYSLFERKQLATVSASPSRGILPIIRAVQKAELLDSNYVALFHDLRVMRNEAAHALDFNPPADSVIKYVQLANELSSALNKSGGIT